MGPRDAEPRRDGTKTYQVTVNSDASFRQHVPNDATIAQRRERRAALADNDSSVTTTVSFNRSPVANNDTYDVDEDGR